MKTPEYRSWVSMVGRCHNSKHSRFSYYGARGITVCDQWRTFANFLKDMGPRPGGFSIERKNNALGYSKDNCIWSDKLTQNNNTRANHRLTHDGVTQTVAQWARQYGLSYQTLYGRITQYGWSIQAALTLPKRAVGRGAAK